MRVAPDRAGQQFDQADPAIAFTLLSGPDVSANRLLADRLLAGMGAEKVAVSGAQLKADPAWLADEAASLAMFGGPRLLWIEPAGEEILPAVEALLALPTREAAAVAIAAPSLKKDGALAKLADAHPKALHVLSELRTARDQVGAILEFGRLEGLRISPPLAERIAEEADGDLALARLELRKFALYLDASPERLRDLNEETVDLLGIDQASTEAGRPGDLALAGDLKGLVGELALLDSDGIDPIPVVRAVQRRLLMLAPLRARIEAGQRPETVMNSVWKRDKAVVGRILPRWPAPRLADAMARVQRLERDLLLRPVPGSAALGETLIELARVAAAARRG